MLERRHAAEQKVRKPEPGDLAVEGPVAARRARATCSGLPVRDVRAEPRAGGRRFTTVEVVAQLVRVVVEERLVAGCRRIRVNPPVTRQHHVARVVAVDVRRRDPSARRTALVAVDRGPVEREAQRVDRVRGRGPSCRRTSNDCARLSSARVVRSSATLSGSFAMADGCCEAGGHVAAEHRVVRRQLVVDPCRRVCPSLLSSLVS